MLGVTEDSLLEYVNPQWVLSLKPEDVKNTGISERGLRNYKQKIRNGKGLKNKSKISRILFRTYRSSDNH